MRTACYPNSAMLEELRLLAPGWRIVGGAPDADTSVLISGRMSEEGLRGAPNLEAVIIPFAGVPVALRELMLSHPQVSVHNLHHNAPETAELAIALMLACAKSVVPIDQALRRGDWTPRYDDAHSIRLAGRTAAVIGYGAIGQRIARSCLGLGMKVIAHRRSISNDRDGDVELRGPDALPQTLAVADVVILAVPHTPETTTLLGPGELAAIKPGAILVNIARAKLVDETALYQALRDHHLRAAGLDVWYRYPEGESDTATTYPSDQPFHELDNVVMSPHRGGSSADVERARIEAIADLLNTSPMPNRVVLERGY